MKAFFFVILLLLAAGCTTEKPDLVQGSGNMVSETREVGPFSGLVVRAPGEVLLTQADRVALEIEAEDNLLPLISSNVRDGVLYLELATSLTLEPTRPILYQIQMRNIEQLEVSSSATLEADTLESERLSIDMSGSGDLHVGALTADDLELRNSGGGGMALDDIDTETLRAAVNSSGSLYLGGSAPRQSVTINGSGSYQAVDLQSRDATVIINGSGPATVWVIGALDAHIMGQGDIVVYGTAEITEDISGSGAIQRREGR